MTLNEGFASYVEYLGVEAVQPELKLLEQFVYLDLQSVFRWV
jgi:aminopeptidase N